MAEDVFPARKTPVKDPRRSQRREMEWADRIPDEEEERRGPMEETYRDGSLKNECWDGGIYEREHQDRRYDP
ncbi:MAG: hypothetical protein IJR97_06655 [Clostridia bacterium]|nr:hypothetical protein [Clostridia bacterium]